jgi:succinate-semialdehyde dehydrogenase/glutarate-semialdehyde dehydrogenase
VNGRYLIENEWLESREKIASLNPATLETVGEACLAASEDCRRAVRAAVKAFPGWRVLPGDEKRKIFRRAKNILFQRTADLARLIALEKGSPLPEAMTVEILGSLEVLDYYGRNLGKTLSPHKIKLHVPIFANKKSFFQFPPLGATLVISPWNFPFLIPLYDIVSALAAGNTVVFRPSTTTPLTGLAIGEIFVEAGLPAGVLNVINCRVPQAEEMILAPEVQTVMFTGSVGTGKKIMELCSRNLTNVVLELGGKDPMIILKDADLDRAARGAVWAGFMNTGQSCASVERVYVAREVYDSFLDKVLVLTKALKVGNPLEPGVDIGPMATLGQLRVVEEHVREAVAKGAEMLCGGKRVAGFPGYFFEPTILRHVNHSMKVMTEETFGPVLPVMPFADLEEAISLANDCRYGLTASIWTRDKKIALAVSRRLEAGTVTVNDHMYSFTEPGAIWGGIKQTGMARSHGSYGLKHLVNIQFVSSDFARKKTQLWWFPYEPARAQVIEKSLTVFHGNGFGKKWKASLSLLKFWPLVRAATPLRNFIEIASRFFRR